MLSLRTTAAMERALRLPLDPQLRSLIEQRMEQLRRNWADDLGDIVEFHVVELGDTRRQITAALGFSLLENLVDGATFGEPDWTPSFEWLLAHKFLLGHVDRHHLREQLHKPRLVEHLPMVALGALDLRHCAGAAEP